MGCGSSTSTPADKNAKGKAGAKPQPIQQPVAKDKTAVAQDNAAPPPAAEAPPAAAPPADEKPAEAAPPTEEKPAEEAPVAEKPAEEAPAAEEAPTAEEKHAEEASAADEKPADEAPAAAEEAPAAEEKPAEEAQASEKLVWSNPPKGKINWAEITAKLPTERTVEQREKRFEMFGQFDANGTGFISLAEVEKGVRDVLQLDDLFDCKEVIGRAYHAAKNANNKRNKPGANGPDFIEKCEFRLLMVFLRQYFELWQMFEEVDTSGDERVGLEEFKQALPKLEAWGVKIEDAEATFKEIDTNDGGKLLFNEFAAWALEKGLDLEDDDDAPIPE